MMEYGNYEIEDLLTDERFVNYCFRSNGDDTAHWERILRDYPQLAGRASEAKQLVLLMAVKVDDATKQVELRRLKGALGSGAAKTNRRPGVRRLPQKAKRWLAAAATVLVFGCAYLLFNRGSVVDRAILHALEQGQPDTIAVTGVGERRRINLPDGSLIVLNGSSQLRVAGGFNETHRVIWLEGDAFFEVAGQAQRPFVVRTAGMVTTALGTSFRVNDAESLDKPYVMLATGKVKVDAIRSGKAADAILLSPGQMAVLDSEEQIQQREFDKTTLTAWLERTLVFQGAGFTEIEAKLLDIYGVSIVADAQLAKTIAFTGQFTNRPLTEVLDAIAFSNRVQFTQSENRIDMVR